MAKNSVHLWVYVSIWLHFRKISPCRSLWPTGAQKGFILIPLLLRRRYYWCWSCRYWKHLQGHHVTLWKVCTVFSPEVKGIFSVRALDSFKVFVDLLHHIWILVQATPLVGLVAGQKAWIFHWWRGTIQWPLRLWHLMHPPSFSPPTRSTDLKNTKQKETKSKES